MALKKAGISLTVDGLSKFLSDIDKVNAATRNLSKTSLGAGDIGKSLGNIGDMSSIGKQSGFSFGEAFKLGFALRVGAAVFDGVVAAAKTAGQLASQGFQAAFNELKLDVKIGAEMQQATADVSALANITNALDQSKIQKATAALSIDPSVVAGYKDVSQAELRLLQSGETLAEVLGKQEEGYKGTARAALLLQNASGGSVDTSSITLAKYQRIFGLTSDVAEKSASIISGTTRQAALRDLNDYLLLLTNASSGIESAHISQLDFAAAVATAGPAFSRGRTEGTAFTAFINSLTPKTDKAAYALEKLGVDGYDAAGNFKPLGQLLEQIYKLQNKVTGSTKNLTEEQRNLYLQEAFGVTGSKFVISLLETSTRAEFEHNKELIRSANVAEQARIKTNTLKAAYENLGDTLETARGAFAIGDEGQDNLLDLLTGAARNLQVSLEQSIPSIQHFGSTFAASLKPAIDTIPKLLAGLSGQPFVIDLANIQVGKVGERINLKLGDIFTFDKNTDTTFVSVLNGALQYAADNTRVAVQIGKLFTFDQSAQKTQINLSDYITFVRDAGGTHFNIGELFTLDDNPKKTTVNLNKYITIANDKIKGTVDLEVGTFNTSIDVAGLKEKLGGIGLAIGAMGLGVISADSALKDLSAPTGGLGQLRAFVTNTIGALSTSINGIDANKTASVGLTISSTLTGVLGVLTKLSDIGNENVGAAAASLTSLTTSLLNFATGVTKGLDGKALETSAGGFISSLIDEFTIALAAPDLVGLADAASGFVLALTSQLKIGFTQGSGVANIAQSLSGFVDVFVQQASAVLSDPKLAANLTGSFQNLAEALAGGLSAAFNNKDLANSLGKGTGDLGGAIVGFIARQVIGAAAADTNPFSKPIDTTSVTSTLFGTGPQVDPNGLAGTAIKFVQNYKEAFDKSIDTQVATQLKPSVLAFETEFSSIDRALNSVIGPINNFVGALAQIPLGLLSAIRTLPGLDQFGKGAPTQPAGSGIAVTGANGASSPRTVIIPDPAPLKAVQTPFGAMTSPSMNTGVAQIGTQNVTAGTVTLTAPVTTPQPGASSVYVQQETAPLPAIAPTLQAGADTASAILTTAASSAGSSWDAAASTVAGGAATAGANLASVQIFPGWGTYIQPVNISSKIPVLNWHEFITPVTPSPSSRDVLGFAGGSPYVPRTGAYLVGERGPEIVTLPQGSGVIPNHQIRSILGAYAPGTPNAAADFINSIKRKANQPLIINVALKGESAADRYPGIGQNRPTPTVGPSMDPQAQAQQKQLNEGVNNLVGQVDKTKEGFKNLGLSIQDLQSDLKGVPGLFGSSTVTAEDMAAAKAGTYIQKADELVRQVQDAAKNGVQYPTDVLGQARDAIAKIGVTPVGDNVGLADQFKALFASGQLFSNKDNLGLINANAVEASIKQQEAQKQGQANIESYFTAMFGGGLSAAVSTGLASAGLGTGGAAQVSSAGGPLGQVPDFPGWTGKDGLIPNFPGWTDKGGLVPKFPGWAQPDGFIPDLNWDDYIDSIKKTATPPVDPTTPATGAASGRNYLRGFAGGTNRLNSIITGENGPELSLFPDGTRIFPASKTAKIMGIAEALARHLPSIQSDPFASLFGGRVSQPQVNVIYRPQTTQQATPNMTKVFQLNLTSQQGADNIMRDFQHMQVVAGAR